MGRVFSGSNVADVGILQLDQAPGAPSFSAPPSYDGANINMGITAPTTDFDGSPLTPNGTGSSGCDELWVCGAFYNADGTNPLDGLGGEQAIGLHLLHTGTSSPGQSHAVALPQAPVPGGANMKIAIFVSDGQP